MGGWADRNTDQSLRFHPLVAGESTLVRLNPDILNLFAKDFSQAAALLECTTNILYGVGAVDRSFELEARHVDEVGKPVGVSAKLMER